jgi:hypothetical protein
MLLEKIRVTRENIFAELDDLVPRQMALLGVSCDTTTELDMPTTRDLSVPVAALNIVHAKPAFLYRCPNTALRVQGWTADEGRDDADTFESMTCPACRQVHLGLIHPWQPLMDAQCRHCQGQSRRVCPACRRAVFDVSTVHGPARCSAVSVARSGGGRYSAVSIGVLSMPTPQLGRVGLLGAPVAAFRG